MTEPTLKDYQSQDLWDFLGRYQRGDTVCVCEWDAGLGKSLLCIMLWKLLKIERMLVACPQIALVSWPQQFQKWCPDVPYLVIKASKDVAKLRPHHRAVVVTFDLCRNDDVRAKLREWATGAFGVIDEAQYLRGHDSKRTGASYGRGEGVFTNIQKIMLMSGDLTVGWNDDLWTHLARWFPERIVQNGQRMGYEQFRDYFLMTRRVPITGTFQHRTQIYGVLPEREIELTERLRGWSIRRTKAEANLPPLTWTSLPLELTDKDRKAIDAELMDNLPGPLQTALARAANAPDDDELQIRVASMMEQYQEYWGVMLRILGAGKAKAACRIIKEKLQNTPARKGLLVFGINHTVLDIVQSELKDHGVLRIDGSTPAPQRARIVDQFQAPNGPRVFAGQITACGTALTLTRADEAYFLQLSPLPGENNQAASRCHRIGQENPVTAFAAMVSGTLDRPLMTILQKKIKAAAARHAA